jgi:hypothetical protein
VVLGRKSFFVVTRRSEQARRAARVRAAYATHAKRANANSRACQVLPLVTELRCAGILSLGRIAAELNSRKVPAPRGGSWHRTTVMRLLARATRIGRAGRAQQPDGFFLTSEQQHAIKRARIAAFDQRLRTKVGRLMFAGYETTDQVVEALNCAGQRTFIGLLWNVKSFGEYLGNHCPDLYEELRGNRRVRWEGIVGAQADTEGLTQSERAAEFNRHGVPTWFGLAWNEDTIGYVARKFGWGKSRAQITAGRAEVKAALDGLARRRGIDREPPLSIRDAAAELTRRLGRIVTVGQLRRLSPRRRHPRIFWTPERRADVLALRQAGRQKRGRDRLGLQQDAELDTDAIMEAW